jgi:hypothetical protein
MASDPMFMTCEQFQAQLADLVESGADIERHPHVQAWRMCRALLSDLEKIADEARWRRF